MPRKEFEAFTRLDASDVNTFLMDQSVMTFGSATARDAAIDTPVEGQVTYLNDIDSLSVYNGTQWVTNRPIMSFAGTAARGSAIPTPVQGMAAYLEDSNILSIYDGSNWKTSLAPTGSILQVVTATTTTNTSTTTTGVNTALSVTITPKSTSNKVLVTSWAQALVHTGNAASSQLRLRRDSTLLDAFAQLYFGSNGSGIEVPASLGILDSPNTTSAVVYGTRIGTANSGNTATVAARQIIIAMEVAG
jgi:hypothetical protein